MALDTQGLFAVEPCMIVVIGAFAGMTTRTGQHLSCSWVKDVFAYGMGKHTVLLMAFTADCIDGGLGHGRMVGTVRRMAVVAGICH